MNFRFPFFARHRDAPQPGGGRGRDLRELVSAANRYRDQYNPLRNLTITRAITLLESAQRGEYADTMWTYHYLEMTNPTLLALVERRTSALLEMDYDCKMASEEKHPGTWDEKLAEDQRAALAAAYEQIGNLYETIEHLGGATFRSFAHVQAQPGSDGVIRHLEPLDQWNFVRDGLYGGWYWNPDASQKIASSLGADAKLDPDRDLLIVRERRRHVDRPGLVMFVRQNLSEKDWDGFVEIYGLPTPVVIGPPNVPAGKETEYESAAEKVAGGGGGYLPNGSDVKYPSETRAQSPFEARLDWLQRQMVLVGTGGMLTMLTESGSGTLAGGAHADTFRSLARAEARQISEIFQQTIDRWVLEAAFPGKPRLAYFALAANDERDVGDIVKHAQELAAGGYVIDPDELSEKTGYAISYLGLAGPGVAAARDRDPDGVARALHRSSKERAEVVQAQLIEASTEAAVLAERRDMRPLAERLYAVLELEDAAAMYAALHRLRDDLPALAGSMLANPELAQALERAMAPAIVNGVAEGVVSRTPRRRRA